MPSQRPNTILIGGGVIGLSLAWELARRGQRVTIVERQTIGREASWAGAGILPPAGNRLTHPYDLMRRLAWELHAEWAARLQSETGVDTGYRKSGALYVASSPGEAAALSAWAKATADEGISIENVNGQRWAKLDPAFANPYAAANDADLARQFRQAFFLPDECQLRNPRHLKALTEVCHRAGVTIVENAEVVGLRQQLTHVVAIETKRGELVADQFCLTAGAWSGTIAQRLDLSLGVVPVRGQMLLYRIDSDLPKRILNEGSRYIVPREDGHLLVGSTEEEAGFDKCTTTESLADLQRFSQRWLPVLEQAKPIQSWAGLRPASFDGWPFLGLAPGTTNFFIATGHFRSGLYLSPSTAVLMAQQMSGETPSISLESFRVQR